MIQSHQDTNFKKCNVSKKIQISNSDKHSMYIINIKKKKKKKKKKNV